MRDWQVAQEKSSFGGERRTLRSEGVDAIRTACLTLRSASPELIRAMNVMVSLDDIPVGPSAAVDLARRIGEEYGLYADARMSRYRLVVRIRRVETPDQDRSPGPAMTQGLFRRVSRVFGLAKKEARAGELSNPATDRD